MPSSFSDSSSPGPSHSSHVLLQNIIDGGDVFLLTETGGMMAHTLYGQLNLANASPTATLVDSSDTMSSSSISVFDYFHNSSFTEEDCGTVLQQSQKKGYASTTVSVPSFISSQQCYVIYKMTYHPEWRVFVDGAEEKLVMMSPSFMGVAVSSGTHDVVFSYEVFWYRKWLLLVSILSLVGLFFWRKIG